MRDKELLACAMLAKVNGTNNMLQNPKPIQSQSTANRIIQKMVTAISCVSRGLHKEIPRSESFIRMYPSGNSSRIFKPALQTLRETLELMNTVILSARFKWCKFRLHIVEAWQTFKCRPITHPVSDGANMVQLPPGVIEETRRGGADVLQIMVRDLVASSEDAYIRVERRPDTGLPRTGYIVFRDGQPAMALHEGDLDRTAIEALMEIEEDAMSIDALLTAHSGIDISPMIELYPEALLHLERIAPSDHEQPAQAGVGEWWNTERLETLSWKKATELPDFIPTMKAPEMIRKMSEARIIRESRADGTVLMGGYLHLINTDDIASVMNFAGELNLRGRPLLSISRQPVERQVSFIGEGEKTCLWLVERPEGDEQIGPSLERLLRLIEGWMDEHRSAVILFDGFEFLSGTHGDDRAFGFLRRLSDLVRNSDDILLMPVVLSAWQDILQHQMMRATDPLDFKDIEEWLIDPDVLDDHPFLELVMDEHEAAAVERKIADKMGLDAPISQDLSATSIETNAPVVERTESGSLDELMQGWAKEASLDESEEEEETVEEDWTPKFHSGETGEALQEDESNVEEMIQKTKEGGFKEPERQRGPRPAIKARRKRPKIHFTNKKVDGVAKLSAAEAVGKDIDGELSVPPDLMSLKTSELGDASNNADEITAELPESDRIDHNAQDALGPSSGVALGRIEKSEIPEASGDLNMRRKNKSWSQATEQERAKYIADWPEESELDQKAAKSLKAATDAAIKPIHMKENTDNEIHSPLLARPGTDAKNPVGRGRNVSEVKQKASDPVSVERRIREKEMQAYKEWKMEGRITPDNLGNEEEE